MLGWRVRQELARATVGVQPGHTVVVAEPSSATVTGKTGVRPEGRLTQSQIGPVGGPGSIAPEAAGAVAVGGTG